MQRTKQLERGQKVPFSFGMNIRENITNWVVESAEEGVFLIDIDWKPASGRIRVLLDGDSGVSIENCRKVSRYLSQKLDEQPASETPYTLEVSSPGADAPLQLLRQYPQHIGRIMHIIKMDGQEVEGKLKSVAGEELSIQLADKKGRYSPSSAMTIVNFTEIKESKIKITFK